MPRIVSSVLLATCLIALLANPTPTSALSNVVPAYHKNRRMIKVREPAFGFGLGPTTTTTTPGAAAATTTAAAVTTTTPAQTTAAATTTPAQGGGSPDQGLTTPGGVTTTTTGTLSSSSTTTTTTAAVVTPTLNLATTPAVITPTLNPLSTVAIESTVAALPTSTAEAATASNSFGRNTIIAIVVIASCVGGAAAIWTLIRKWKLGTSAKFDNRLNPVEWSPDAGADGDKDIITPEKQRRTSSGSHGSFHSGSDHHANLGRNVTGNANMFADQNPSVEAHDFTAGPADAYGQHAAGYGNYDYGYGGNGLQRQKSSGAELTREPSNGRGLPAGAGYDHYAAYGQDAYAQDAYGGYDAYGQQPHPAAQDPYTHAQYPPRY